LKEKHTINEEIQKTIIKTSEFTRILLNRFAKEILNKYIDNLYGVLPTVTEQQFNKAIKEACQVSGINAKVNITRYSGSNTINKTVPKYDLVTSHTANKTFSTK
jgi:hypothetical protein